MNKDYLEAMNEQRNSDYIPNEKAEFAVKILHQYADENSVIPRSTSDLSKLEEWLLVKMFFDAKSNDLFEKQKLYNSK